MKLVILLLCMVQYVYGGCLVNPDSDGHVSAADLENTLGIHSSTIATNAFSQCYALKSVEIPASVTTINADAFYLTSWLKNITFLGNISSLKGYAYKNFGSYFGAFMQSGQSVETMSITFMGNVGTIESFAFYQSGLNANTVSVTFMGNVGTIEKEAFHSSGKYASTMTVDFRGDVTTIGDFAFYQSGVTSIPTYGGNAPSLGFNVFQGSQYEKCRLDEVPLGMNLTTGHGTYRGLSTDSFKDCNSLTSVTILGGVETIGTNHFYKTHLTSLIIPESVVNVGGIITAGVLSYGTFYGNPITELAILGTPTFNEKSSTLYYYRTFSRRTYPYSLQLERYCFNHSALSIKDQLDVSNAVHDCTFWCETGTGQISTTYHCTKPWSTACDAGFYFAPKPTGMQVSMSDTCTPCTSGFQPKNNSVATSCTPWTNCSTLEYLVTAGSATADAVCESWDGKRRLATGNGIGSFGDAPIASPSELQTAWSSKSCGEKIVTSSGVPDSLVNETMCQAYAEGTDGILTWHAGPHSFGNNYPKGCILYKNEHVYYNTVGANSCSVHSDNKCIKNSPAFYQRESGTCDVGKICFTNYEVLECPSGAVRLNETHCSSEKEVVYAALKSHCPL